MKTASAIPVLFAAWVMTADGAPEKARVTRIGPEMTSPLALSRDTDGSLYVLDGGSAKQPPRIFRMAGTGKSEVFAQIFPSTRPPTGLLARRGTVFVQASPDAWELGDADGDGKSDRGRVLLTGLGADDARSEHGLSSAIQGPDGRLYWAVGDAGIDTTAREGYPLTLPDEGCVMRCNPDGSVLEIYARGLRDVRQLAFDESGNLFGIDHITVPLECGRLLYIAENADYGWRSYYEDRRKVWNPWRDEILTRGPEHPADVLPAAAGYSGRLASGLCVAPDGGFYVTPSPAGEPVRMRIAESGAGFRAEAEAVVETGIAASRAVSAPDGGLLLLGVPSKGPNKPGLFKWRPAGRAPAQKTSASQASTEELLARLDDADGIVRADAQAELSGRPDITPTLLQTAAASKDRPLFLVRVLWTLSARRVFDRPLFLELVHSQHPEVRLQAARWAGEMKTGVAKELIPLLQDPSLQVRYHAAMALGKTHSPDAFEPLLGMLAENDNRDPWLRHAGITALRGYWLGDVLKVAREHPSAAVRLAAVASISDRAPERLSALHQDPDAGVQAEIVRAMYQAKLPSNGPNRQSPAARLAWLLFNDAKNLTPGSTRRALAAARLAADRFSGELLAKYIGDPNHSEALRLEALRLIATWHTELKIDPLDGRPRQIGKGELIDRDLAGLFGALIYGQSPTLASAARETAAALKIEPTGGALQAAAVVMDVDQPVNQRILAMEQVARGRPAIFNSLLERLLRDGNAEIRFAAARLGANIDPEQVAGFAGRVLGASSNIPELRQAMEVLMRVHADYTLPVLISCLGAAAADRWPAEVTLELVEATNKTLEAIPDVRLAKAKGNFEAHVQQRIGKLAPYASCLSGGDAVRGRDIFENFLTARCTDCHNAKGEVDGVVPRLTHIGATGRVFILESLVFPNEHLEPAYAVITATCGDGRQITGNVRMETSESLTLRKTDGSEETVQMTEIVSRTAPTSPMPSSDRRLTQDQIRDLVEYLSSRQ